MYRFIRKQITNVLECLRIESTAKTFSEIDTYLIVVRCVVAWTELPTKVGNRLLRNIGYHYQDTVPQSGMTNDYHLGFSLISDTFRSKDRLCGLVVRVLGYRSGGARSIPGTTKKKSSGSGTVSTQPREYN
jgi:hypothetical protein